jgi:hypothetical protein
MVEGSRSEARTGNWLWTLLVGGILLVMEFVLFAALIPTDWSEHVRSKEQVWLRTGLTGETADRVVARAERWYGTLFEDSGLVAATYRITLPSSRDLDRAGALSPLASLPVWSWVKGRLDVVWNGVYQALQRTAVFAAWWPFLLLLFTAAWGDGWVRRRIRQSGFAYASPLAHAYALRGVIGIVLVGCLLFFLPVPWPVLGVPAAGAVLTAFVGVAVSNAQKRL